MIVTTNSSNTKIATWLAICAFFVALMVAVGGATRLTDSGLSITEWRPVTGTLPPLSSAEWESEFNKYQASPEYNAKNYGMNMAEFKYIYWWEYGHRLLGRIVGMVFLLPLLFFAINNQQVRRRLPVFLVLLALGGMQGLFGWLMVRSGLIDVPYVNPLRLALHLSTALLLFWGLVMLSLDFSPCKERHFYWPVKLKPWLRLIIFITVLQIVIGAVVAGLDAGLVHNTFPTMSGSLLPPGGFGHNWLTSAEIVQWWHRLGGTLLLAAVSWLGLKVYNLQLNENKIIGQLLIVVIIVQFCLGVATILTKVNLWAALFHQVWVLVLLSLLAYIWYQISQRQLQLERGGN
ncbi:MAG: COX15/CtaA family protein [Pseudomonadota bacterium]